MLSETWIENLPIRHAEARSSHFEGFWLSRAGLTLGVGGRRVPIMGFGASVRREDAARSAKWELLERLLMCPEVTGTPDRSVAAEDLVTRTARRPKPFCAVTPRPWHRQYVPDQDATGVAVHRDRERAIDAAVNEVLERACLAELWYGRAPLPEPGRLETLPGRLRLVAAWPLASYGYFAIAVAWDQASRTLTCGSAVRVDQAEARAHAVGEAVMVFESVADGLASRYSSAIKTRRLESLRGELSDERYQHVLGRITDHGMADPANQLIDPERLVRSLTVYQLVSSPTANLVRVVPRGGEALRTCRSQSCDLPADPFV